jgi:peptidoglycan-associated lipoprotein
MAGATRSARLTFGSLAVALALTGCAGRSWQFWTSPATESPTTPVTPVVTSEPAAPAPVSVPTARPAAASEVAAAAAPTAEGFVEVPALVDVRFRAGVVTITRADRATLDAVVRWLTQNPAAQVQIEGHTDDLGTPVENLAVGQKRATSTMSYLVSRGVSTERIAIVSYGSDRPVCVEKTDACRARNRRVHFLVKQH